MRLRSSFRRWRSIASRRRRSRNSSECIPHLSRRVVTSQTMPADGQPGCLQRGSSRSTYSQHGIPQSFPFVRHPTHAHRLLGWRRRQNEQRCSPSRKAIHVVLGSGFLFERTKHAHEVSSSSLTKWAIEPPLFDIHGTARKSSSRSPPSETRAEDARADRRRACDRSRGTPA